ncbi:hypothetical protein B0T11DRAFT_331641 [Plectosphaerella cucumerina]|uniref:Uncharacterized protein n=1 Tax=Plectosphaerella cucumerina TaxID=40658 RepID=A0A8K0X071_9PEZI|nr:hypothetical protein B0T11DRAFT_331641 [Plectosphaerella cucumerina]
MGSSPSRSPPPADVPSDRVTGSTWETHPIKNPKTAPWDLPISLDDFNKLIKGYQPQAMEDRWMCRADGPDAQGNITVYIYRSWTGYEHYQITAASSPDGSESDMKGARITGVTWESGKSGGISEEEAKDLAIKICRAKMGCVLSQAPQDTS